MSENSNVSHVLTRLKRVADHEMSESDIKSTTTFIRRLLDEEYTPDEVFRELRWTEEVNEKTKESVALNRMRMVRQSVEQRLGRKLGKGK